LFTAHLETHEDMSKHSNIIRPVNSFNLVHFVSLINQINWISVYCSKGDVNSKFKIFFDLFLWALNTSMPLKHISNKKKSVCCKWYHVGLIEIKQELDRLYYLMTSCSTGCETIRGKYNQMKKMYKSEIRNAKLNYNSSLINNCKNKTKAAWNVVNQTLNVNRKPVIKPNGLTSVNFNDFFIESVDNISNNIPPSISDYHLYLRAVSSNQNNVFSFSLKEFTVESVYSAICSLSNSTCLDIYGINAPILKIAAKYISEVLAYLFNESISQGVFPDILKQNKVIPVHKKGAKDEPKNYWHNRDAVAQLEELALDF